MQTIDLRTQKDNFAIFYLSNDSLFDNWDDEKTEIFGNPTKIITDSFFAGSIHDWKASILNKLKRKEIK